MAYRVDGVGKAIALALGVVPWGGCTDRVLDEGFVGVPAGSDGSSSGSSSGGTGVDTTGQVSVGSLDDSSSGFVSDVTGTGPVVRSCFAEVFPEVDLCWGVPVGGACVCDDDCQWNAANLAWELYPDNAGCYYPGTVSCAEAVEGECCFTVRLQYEDFCGEGRPLIVEGEARVAALVSGTGWGTGATAQPHPAVAEHWLRAALQEHASVASFARFALELMGVGAPAVLLADTARAMRDEVRHAELAFGLARRFGAKALTPGPLDAGPVRSMALCDVVVATVREGCIGETLAAAQAELAARRATDPEVAEALQEIAADEARHAALAWQVVQWALSEDPSLGPVVARAFAEARGLDLRPCDPAPGGLEAFGVLPGDAVAAVRRQTLRETIEPFAAALLVTTEPSRGACTP